ncbi:hypothetical protein KFU94_25790 [Chloroflexi bacterium TSY]|nr:hypothetical protein [Chloroflexi bacterium TSY]
MIPRAEIAMIIMQHGRSLGDWAVPPELFGAMVIIVLATCLFVPVMMVQLLRKFPQTAEQAHSLPQLNSV